MDLSTTCTTCIAGENEVMAMCKKCGVRKRRWPRSCSECGSGSGRATAAEGVADLDVPTGLFEWVWRGVVAVFRMVLRLFD